MSLRASECTTKSSLTTYEREEIIYSLYSLNLPNFWLLGVIYCHVTSEKRNLCDERKHRVILNVQRRYLPWNSTVLKPRYHIEESERHLERVFDRQGTLVETKDPRGSPRKLPSEMPPKCRFETASSIIFPVSFPFLSYSSYQVNSDLIFKMRYMTRALHVNLMVSSWLLSYKRKKHGSRGNLSRRHSRYETPQRVSERKEQKWNKKKKKTARKERDRFHVQRYIIISPLSCDVESSFHHYTRREKWFPYRYTKSGGGTYFSFGASSRKTMS